MKGLGFNQHGNIDVMTLLDLPEPATLKPHEVLIDVKASSLNHLDIHVRNGWPELKLPLPHICGSDAAGIIEAVGDEVKNFNVGDRVSVDPGISLLQDEFTLAGRDSVSPGYSILGERVRGTHAEKIIVPAENLVLLPANISFEIAAASGLVGVTAWRMLVNQAQMKAGDSVLVIGAGGGVNTMAIQLAKVAGCTVYVIAGGEDKVAKAKALGADVVLDYKAERTWAQKLFNLSHQRGFDIVIDNVGKATINTSMRLVKNGGKIVIVGSTSGPNINLDLRPVFIRQISIIGSTMGSHLDYKKIMEFIFAGKIKPVIHAVLPLSKGVEGMKMLEDGIQFGKIVLAQ